MASEPKVYVVDDESGIRESVRLLVETVDLDVETFASFQDFHGAYDPDRPACLVLDIRMPGIGGIEALEILKADAVTIPVIVITGYADVPTGDPRHEGRSGRLGCGDVRILPGIPQCL